MMQNSLMNLKPCVVFLQTAVSSPLPVLRRLHDSYLNEVPLNVSAALRISLTIPVTAASGERFFSKFKLIKTHLRSSTAQDRLVGLAMLSIENDVACCHHLTSSQNLQQLQRARCVSDCVSTDVSRTI